MDNSKPEIGQLDFSEMAEEIKEKTFYKLTDAFSRNYVFFQLPETDNAMLLAGPYITEEDPHEAILERAELLGMDHQRASQIEKHYNDIILLSEDSRLFAALDAFCDVIWGEDGFSYVNVNTLEEPVFSQLLLQKDTFEESENWDMEMMERRYAFENKIMEAVSRGQTYKAEMFFNAFSPASFEQRLPDTLRNSKNYMIIMNTILRKAAEQGGVHPIYLDKISSGFAREMESFNTVKAIPGFMKRMFEAYCRLVRKHATMCYSTLVRNVILYIDADLSADLSLKKMAERNGVSAGYLSACFKNETGKNFVDYVNSKRMDMAKHLLKTTRLQVQTIAQHCGFLDIQYFSKVFKKYVNVTPRQYREERRGRIE